MYTTILRILPYLMICIHLDSLCFDLPTYTMIEDDGQLQMTLILSRALPFEVSVEFVYQDFSARRGKLVICCVILIVM